MLVVVASLLLLPASINFFSFDCLHKYYGFSRVIVAFVVVVVVGQRDKHNHESDDYVDVRAANPTSASVCCPCCCQFVVLVVVVPVVFAVVAVVLVVR